MTHRKYFDAYLAYSFQRFCANKSARSITDFSMKFSLPDAPAAKGDNFYACIVCMYDCSAFDYFLPQLITVISNCCQSSVGFHQYKLPNVATAVRFSINYYRSCHAARHFADNFAAVWVLLS